MNKTRLKVFGAGCALFACLLCSGCFTVTEKITFQDRESGTFSLITDLATLYTMMEAMGSKAPPEEIEKEFAEMEEDLKKIAPELEAVSGITNVTTGYDVASYTATLSFEFRSLKALNQGMSIVYSRKMELESIEQKTYFTGSRQGLERSGEMGMLDRLRESFPQDEEGAMEAMQFFRDAAFKLHYTLPRPVTRVSNPDMKIGASPREVELPFYLFRPEFADKTLATRIEF